MDPENYCGASRHHVHFNNFIIEEGQPLKLWNRDETDKITTWLDMKNCSGCIDATTFSLLPELHYINMIDCNIGKSCRPFSTLNKLRSVDIRNTKLIIEKDAFEDSQGITSLGLYNHDAIGVEPLIYLDKLEQLIFDNCKFNKLDKDLFSGLKALKFLTLTRSVISYCKSDMFDEITSLEYLDISSNTINYIDPPGFDSILKLTHLKSLALYNNKINSLIDYQKFKKLLVLEDVLFDVCVYKNFNFERFLSLKMVRIAFDGTPNSECDLIIEDLESKNIKFQYVPCGNTEYDLSQVQICA